MRNFNEIEALYYSIHNSEVHPFWRQPEIYKFESFSLSLEWSSTYNVKKENFKEFGSSLEHLSLLFNKIKFIYADLFEFNPNLKAIFMHDDPIRHFDTEFFTNLRALRFLEHVNLNAASCIPLGLSFV